ncbi:hypothetical protein D3C84_1020810 [compost metagenome]
MVAKSVDSLKVGMIGVTSLTSAERAQMIPVPRGPNIHLWVPAMKKSQCMSGKARSSTPKPCTPSTTYRMWSFSSR